jgi:hypothetical protein
MSGVPVFAFSLLAAGAALSLPAYGQAVISTRSGLVHFFDGTVSVAGQPLESRFGKFAEIPEGADLRTEQGRAEILLTPGVVLRVSEKSAIRMVATALADTRVELLAGSAILESAEPAAGTSVTLTYKEWNIRQVHAGVYRVYNDPPKLQVREGEVEVAAGGDAPVTVEKGMDLAFEKILTPEKSPFEPADAFTEWADGRAQSISTDNAIAADIQDPATMSGTSIPADAFTYFPMLGLPVMSSLNSYGGSGGYGAAIYGTSPLYQSGFYSIYLPGYTYRPLLLRVPLGFGLGRTLYPPTIHPPLRLGTPPPTTVPRLPVTRPLTAPAVAHPTVVHPAIHVGGK